MWLGRWARARRWLRSTGSQRVLDVGCAFGFGTNELAVHSVWIAGIEQDRAYRQGAARSYPHLAFCGGDAERLPVESQSVDAVVVLDVLEHLADPAAAAREALRVVRRGGRVLVSVPNRGVLAVWDSLNVYAAMREQWQWLPPLEKSEQSAGGLHRHFSVDDVLQMFGLDCTIERVAVTGVGAAEAVHLVVLLLTRGLLRSERAYRALRYVYYTAYLVEDLIPVPRAGYHLMVQLRRG